VLAVDPGREKCGVAVVDRRDGVLARGVVPTSVIEEVVRPWVGAHRPSVLLLGKGTGLQQIRAAVRDLGVRVEVVPETNTTRRARARYFAEHPPRGWRRLIPLGLQTPPVPVDDYAAVLIAEDYLSSLQEGSGGLIEG
jgi:RNase H-fold protein (predicted Holliday junction resolvase)